MVAPMRMRKIIAEVRIVDFTASSASAEGEPAEHRADDARRAGRPARQPPSGVAIPAIKQHQHQKDEQQARPEYARRLAQRSCRPTR